MTKLQSIKEWAKSAARAGNTAKGNAFEQRIADYLRGHGWTVEVTMQNRSIRKGRWVTRRADYFGVFDLLAIHPDLGTAFIQATTAAAKVPEKTAKIDAKFTERLLTPFFDVIIPGVADDFRVFRRQWGGDEYRPRWEGPLSADYVYCTRRKV